MSSLGDRLRRLRRERNWTQEEVSSHLSVVRSTYAYYESGKTLPDNNTIIQLAALFDVTTDYLLKGEDTPPKAPEIVPVTYIRDESYPAYNFLPVSEEPISEWQLKETEQRLVIAFRHLSKGQQRIQLEEMEKQAWLAYGKRKQQFE